MRRRRTWLPARRNCRRPCHGPAPGPAAGRRDIRRQAEQHLIFDRHIGLGRPVGRPDAAPAVAAELAAGGSAPGAVRPRPPASAAGAAAGCCAGGAARSSLRACRAGDSGWALASGCGVGVGTAVRRLRPSVISLRRHDIDRDRLSGHRAERMHFGKQKHQRQQRQMRDRRCRDVRRYDLPQFHRSDRMFGMLPGHSIAPGAPLLNPISARSRNRSGGPWHFPCAEICAISSSDSSKSKISMFSDSRSSFEVRGIAATFCCTSQRRQTCAARLAVRSPIRSSARSFLMRPLAIGL